MAEQTASEHSSDLSTGLRKRVASFLRDHDPATTAAVRFLRARFDAGLAWLHFPEGFGGLGLPRGFQSDVDRLFAEMMAAGYNGLQPPFDAFWGARYAILEDPDGIAVGLMSTISPEHRAPPPAV